MSYTFLFLLTFALTLTLTITAIRILLPILTRRHLGQRILEIGPAWHRSKEGTPTMGGLSFVISCFISLAVAGALLFSNLPPLFWRPMLLTLLFALGNAAIGAVDDLSKFRKKQNEGLSPSQKLILQFSVAGAYIALLQLYGYLDTTVYIPYLDVAWDLGLIYYLPATLLAVGMVNFFNLTDGIDGLAASNGLIYAAFFAVAATLLDEAPTMLLATAMMAACLGFLFFNRHPARIFMGDTGSLFLGGMGVGCGFLIANPLLILVVGGVFLLEGISVILQVGFYKMTGRRLFLMAPLHHHLEKRGMCEEKIVLFFALLGLAFGLIAIPGLF